MKKEKELIELKKSIQDLTAANVSLSNRVQNMNQQVNLMTVKLTTVSTDIKKVEVKVDAVTEKLNVSDTKPA